MHIEELCPPKENEKYYLLSPQKLYAHKDSLAFVKLPKAQQKAQADVRVAVILGKEKEDYAMDYHYVDALSLFDFDIYFIHYEDVDAQLEQISPHAILLPGGSFDSPKEFYAHPEFLPSTHHVSTRSLAYIYAIDYAKENKIPMLGICAGFQMLAGMYGAKMYASVHKELAGSIEHKKTGDVYAHKVNILPQTHLAAICPNLEFEVNSVHSEAVIKDESELEGIRFCAFAPDDAVEALEGSEDYFVLGVQWHPEYFVNKDAPSRAIFEAFYSAGKKRKEEENANRRTD